MRHVEDWRITCQYINWHTAELMSYKPAEKVRYTEYSPCDKSLRHAEDSISYNSVDPMRHAEDLSNYKPVDQVRHTEDLTYYKPVDQLRHTEDLTYYKLVD